MTQMNLYFSKGKVLSFTLISQDCHSKYHKLDGLKQQKIIFLVSQRPKVQNHYGRLREEFFLASSTLWQLLAILGLWQHHAKLCLCLHMAFFPGVSLSHWSPSPFFYRYIFFDLGSNLPLKTLNISRYVITTKTLLSCKVTLLGNWHQDINTISLGDTIKPLHICRLYS